MMNVIFDIDGVIVDSEALHFDVLKQRLPVETHGVDAESLIGLSLMETLHSLGIPLHRYEALEAELTRDYQAALDQNALRPDVITLIGRLRALRIPFGFVSTAPRDVCLANIGLLNLPSTEICLISGDDTARTKPYPDPYLNMLNHLSASPEETVVIEDTDLGIEAAKQAGIRRVYAWPHGLSSGQHYRQADAVIRSLHDIDVFDALWAL